LALVVAVAPLAACSPTIRQPQLLHPGPAGVQRHNAAQFDPYPPNDVGPKIVGGRPPDYAVPPNEVTRSRQFMPNGPRSALPVLVPQVPAYTPVVPTLPPTTPTSPPVEYRY
jgi:hypothetical protein